VDLMFSFLMDPEVFFKCSGRGVTADSEFIAKTLWPRVRLWMTPFVFQLKVSLLIYSKRF